MSDSKDEKTHTAARASLCEDNGAKPSLSITQPGPNGGSDATPASDHTITLISKDGKTFPVGYKSASISHVVEDSFTFSKSHVVEGSELPVKTSSQTLELVVRYMKKYEGKPPAVKLLNIPSGNPLGYVCEYMLDETRENIIRSSDIHTICRENKWDANFIDEVDSDRRSLIRLTFAAFYLDIRPLSSLCAAKLGSLVHGKEMRQFFELLNPNSPAVMARGTGNNGAGSSSSTPDGTSRPRKKLKS